MERKLGKQMANLSLVRVSYTHVLIYPRIDLDLMKLPATRRNALCMTLCWFAFSMGYFGLVYNTPAFDWNIYLVFIFPTFLMIPLSLLQPLMENRLGRKPVMTSTMVLAGVCLLTTAIVPKGIIVIILGNMFLLLYRRGIQLIWNFPSL